MKKADTLFLLSPETPSIIINPLTLKDNENTDKNPCIFFSKLGNQYLPQCFFFKPRK